MHKALLAALIATYAALWLGGIVSYALLGGPPPGAQWTAPAFLLLAGLAVGLSAGRQDWPVLGVAAIGGFAAEVCGVKTGWPFGQYAYTSALAPSLFGVPLVMVCAWVILTAYVRQMLWRLSLPAWLVAVAGGLWMTAMDLVIDPLAANALGYWHWAEGGSYYGIPAGNFLGWFVVSTLICGLVRAMDGGAAGDRPIARAVGLSVMVFFTLIALAQRQSLAAACGLALCAWHWALRAANARLKLPALRQS